MTENSEHAIEPVVMYPNRLKFLPLLTICAALCTAGIHLINQGHWEGLYLAILFGFSSLLMLTQMHANCSYLIVDADGLTICSQYRERRWRWEEIESFGQFDIAGQQRVGLNFTALYQGPERKPAYLCPAHGYHLGLPCNYQLPAEELIEFLERCQQAKLRL